MADLTYKKRAIIYARVSSDDVRNGKEGRNLDEQVRMGREYAEGKGYTVIAEMPEDDRGASGANLDLPQLQAVFSKARSREFDVLVVRELDRLSRSLAKQLIIEEELKREQVEIDYVLATYEDSPEGTLNKNIKAVISEYERLKIKERMARGRRVSAKQGNIVSHGHAPYGYDLVVEGDKANKRTKLKTNPREAEIVKLIFTWYSQGMTIRGMVKELTRLAIPTPGDSYPEQTYHKLHKRGEWGRSTIYSILQNESYTGSWHYGKRSPKTTNSKKMITNARDTWIRVEIPAIIDLDLWEESQRLLKVNRERGPGRVKNDYLLRGHLSCGDCQGRLVGTSNISRGKLYTYYVCRSQKVGRTHRDFSYPSLLVDEIAWLWIKQLLLNPVAINEGLATYKQEQERLAEPTAMHISAIEGLLIQHKESLKRLLDLYISGDLFKEMLVEKKNDLENKISELEKERTKLVAGMKAQSFTFEQEQTIIEFTQKLGKNLEIADNNFSTKKSIIEAMRVEAILRYEDGQKTIRIKCILGEDYYVLSPAISFCLAVV